MNGEDPKKAADLPYRPGVGAMLLSGEGEVFVGRRSGVRRGYVWQMPQGGIDDGETPAMAVKRELAEEIGTDKADIIAETKGWLTYDLPDDLIGVSWGGRYRGQTQKWFALRFTGLDADFDLGAHGKPEFTDWKWVAMAELPGLVVPFKRRLYDEILAEFQDLAEPKATGA
ncbi:MAG: RNA pyrophosphohydrolase [Rhodospirillaceae bacterium]|jgi:putative (di)nucleoside polyphosphate hydrolase|nr:RNA pyrophosphohydrolase [Rhodospirillaceae bacterium]|tara:strand:- start:1271 stop:1783 length:513 start_codon:yes stop_codon:yes gene_type:complete